METQSLRNPRFVTLFALGWFVLSSIAQAVNPPPDGGYAFGNTAEGASALLSLTTGAYNTGVGLFSLRSNRDGNFNTATGAGTLLANTADENTATGTGALLSNTTGTRNTANGTFALFGNTTGNDGVTGESNTIRIGDPAIHAALFVAGVTAMNPSAPTQAVLVDPATGQL